MSPARVVPDPPFTSTPVATFNEPWAMTFLPDGRLLVTEKRGRLALFDPASKSQGEVSGVPEVDYGGQGGFGGDRFGAEDVEGGRAGDQYPSGVKSTCVGGARASLETTRRAEV